MPYHSGYCFKTEARQADDVSKFEYGAERSFLWMIKASADVADINPLHQVAPGNTADLYLTPVRLLYLASDGQIPRSTGRTGVFHLVTPNSGKVTEFLMNSV